MMKRFKLTGIAGFALLMSGAVTSCTAAKQDAILITNVTAIDSVEGNLGVVDIAIVDNLIGDIGTDIGSRFNVATTIDGTGKFAIPGLWDAHVHLAYDPNIGLETFFPLSLAHGVTSLRDTGGHLDLLAEARAVSNADAAQPDLYVSGPLLDGEQRVYDGDGIPDLSVGLASVDEARAKVDELAAQGVSFVKAYEMLKPDVFAAVADQAKSHGLPVAAHIPLSMTGQQAVDAGAKDMQHFRNLEFACASNEMVLLADRHAQLANEEGLKANALRRAIHTSQRVPAVSNQDPGVCDQFIKSLADNDVYQTPTLTVTRFMVRQLFADPKWQQTFPLMRPSVSKGWAERSARLQNPEPSEDDRAYDAWVMGMVARLSKAGVSIMAGTDAPIGYLTPGASLHEELYMLVEAGLSPQQALRAATYEPARFLGLEAKTGSMEAGLEADIVVLNANPLTDIRSIENIDMVIKSGSVLNRDHLDKLMTKPASLAD